MFVQTYVSLLCCVGCNFSVAVPDGGSLVVIAGSNPAEGKDVRLLCLFSVVQVAASATD